MDSKEVCKFFMKYSKQYMGSRFSVPLPDEIEEAAKNNNLSLVCAPAAPDFTKGEIEAASIYSRTTKPLSRRSFTGAKYVIPADVVLVEHLAHIPELDAMLWQPAQVVYCYLDDHLQTDWLRERGYDLKAVKIAATSEMLGVYAKSRAFWPDDPYKNATVDIAPSHEPADEVTLAALPSPQLDREAILAEVGSISAYRDDYPYYNRNNSWAAASLRGYKPEDPLYGLKPAEMSRKWQLEHPEDMALTTCHDTVLAEKCPALMAVLSSLPFGSGFDRVRLLRLGKGELTRHCDITDRELGTRDGQICRFHMPLVTHSEVRSECWGIDGKKVSINLKPWTLYYMDIRKPHAAKNPSAAERIHLQIDVVADERLRQALLAADQQTS